MKSFTQIRLDKARPIEFLFESDLEVALHEGEDRSLGVHTEQVLSEMLKEVGCEHDYADLPPVDFVLSNGDTDARFEKSHEHLWKPLESLCPSYHVMGNHEGGYFEGDGNRWREYLGYDETYYA
ncbi:MAG: metallophosphoesterase, partial [Candidatus Latescibacterota bacterium]